MTGRTRNTFLAAAFVACYMVFTAFAQYPPQPRVDAVEKLGPNLFALGQVRVDTAKREVSVPGRANNVTVLEFVANTRNGMKAYESALTLETSGVTFNTALLLIGLDKSHARVPEFQFDPKAPEGDHVELWVEWERGGKRSRVPAEQLLYDRERKSVVSASAWVYTGSSFYSDSRYAADNDGVLIGFMHTPAPIIEQVGGTAVGRYGFIIMNPDLGLEPETPVTVTVKALKTSGGGER
jgi:hypothetical protein